MFCKYKGPETTGIMELEPETIYWINFVTINKEGEIEATVGKFWWKFYSNFEEFLGEWEIV